MWDYVEVWDDKFGFLCRGFTFSSARCWRHYYILGWLQLHSSLGVFRPPRECGFFAINCHGQLVVWMSCGDSWHMCAHAHTHSYTSYPLSCKIWGRFPLRSPGGSWRYFWIHVFTTGIAFGDIPSLCWKTSLDSPSWACLGLWLLFYIFEAMNTKVQVHQVQPMSLECCAALTTLSSTSFNPWAKKILNFSVHSFMPFNYFESRVFSCFQ